MVSWRLAFCLFSFITFALSFSLQLCLFFGCDFARMVCVVVSCAGMLQRFSQVIAANVRL